MCRETPPPPVLRSQWRRESLPVPRRQVISSRVDYFNYSRTCGTEAPSSSLLLHTPTRWAITTSANQFGSGLLSGLGWGAMLGDGNSGREMSEIGTVVTQAWKVKILVVWCHLQAVGAFWGKWGIVLIPVQLLEAGWAWISMYLRQQRHLTFSFFFHVSSWGHEIQPI